MRLFAGTQFDRPPKCDRCGKLESECGCSPLAGKSIPPGKQVARLRLEKRKKGKVVTVIRGLAVAENELSALLRRLKSQCGAGGTLQEDGLEIQGDHVQRIGDALRAWGYQVSP
jgi:translation initiation factor 1